MPGRCATLATCSMARSSDALTINSSEANTTPGTAIPSLGVISQRVSSRCSKSMPPSLLTRPPSSRKLLINAAGWVFALVAASCETARHARFE